ALPRRHQHPLERVPGQRFAVPVSRHADQHSTTAPGSRQPAEWLHSAGCFLLAGTQLTLIAVSSMTKDVWSSKSSLPVNFSVIFCPAYALSEKVCWAYPVM